MDKNLSSITDEETKISLGHISPIKESNIKEMVTLKVIESKEGDGKRFMEVKLIEEGLSKNRKYYSKKVAESVADLILDRNQMFMDHSWGWFGRSFKDLVAVAKESWKKDGASYAKVQMANNPITEWLYELAKDFEGLVGASIDAFAKMREAEKGEGVLWGEPDYDPENLIHPVMIVEEITFLNSVDFVTYAAAGGVVTKLMASTAPTPEVIAQLSKFMESFQKQVANINSNNKEEHSMEKNTELTLEVLKSDHKDLITALKEEIVVEIKKEDKSTAEMETLKQDNSDLKEQVSNFEKEVADLKTEVDGFKLKELVAAKKQLVADLIKEADLSEEFVSDTFKEDLMKLDEADDIKIRIADRKKLIENTNGAISGNGQRPVKKDDTVDPKGEKVSEDSLVSNIKSQNKT